ncbi:MAG: peptidoglycan DD-metalloendopeptidase family protein [Endomicrobia bacterium]|nr:peptidoglycan DD-metalloendopeptidase family protein [Endomicrobiia bacterium]
MKIKILLTIVFISAQLTYGQETADIKSQSKELSDVRKSIKEKKLEKDRLALQEKVFKRELKALNDAISENEKNLSKLSQEIKTAEANLAAASKQYAAAYSRQNDINNSMLEELELYNKMTFLRSYEQDPVEYKIRQAALEYKKSDFDKECEAAEASSFDIKKWEKAKNDLIALRQRETNLETDRKNLMAEKNDLLKNTSARKAAAEEEIKSLNESAEALKALIKKLTADAEEKKKKETAATAAVKAPVSQVKRKKDLPWPLDGKVILKFGKNKHPELDTYVISNGIKIKAADLSQVKSVDSGTVVFAGDFRSYGKVVIIDHKDSYFTVYGQLDQILVKEDQKVSKNTAIAKLGSADNSVLYFEIRQNNVPDDPLLWLKTASNK